MDRVVWALIGGVDRCRADGGFGPLDWSLSRRLRAWESHVKVPNDPWALGAG